MSASTAASAKTRDALILAGERLFGEKGIDGVSLRQINSAAGQRNASAAHYHFGSKEALVSAVYEYRMASVNGRRLQRLQALHDTGREHDVHAIVEAIVYPIVEEIRDTEGGSHYIRFMAQVIGHPKISLAEIWNSRFAEGLAEVINLLRAALPEVPAVILGQRFGLMWEQAIHALADREKLSGSEQRMVAEAVFVGNLVDMIAAGLAAAVSDQTRQALARST